MIEIRRPDEADRQQIVDLMRISFNAPPAWVRLIAPGIQLDRFLCAYEGGRMVAMSQAWDLAQWFGGRSQPMAGIAAVAAVPERRSSGLAPEVLVALLRDCREKGAAVSSLYPSRVSVYRRLGYEYAGLLTQYRMPFADLPAVPAREIEELNEVELDAVRACYRRFAAENTGMADSNHEDWWRLRVIRRWNPDVSSRAVIVRGAGGAIDGYACFQLDAMPDTWGYRIACSHLVGCTHAAVSSLLGYFRSFRGLGQVLAWYGPPNEPLGLVVGGGAETIQPARTIRFMTRILDVPRALESRGYPEVSGSATIAVRDELFPDNQGPFRMVVEGGVMKVERLAGGSAGGSVGGAGSFGSSGAAGGAGSDRAGGAISGASSSAAVGSAGRSASGSKFGAASVIPIGALSALFTGYLTPADLVRVGYVTRDDPSLPFLGRLFAGPTPWMTDFF